MRITIYEPKESEEVRVSESRESSSSSLTAQKVQQRLTLKQLPQEDRPREKILKHGVRNLSDAELLAILIGSGTRQETAVQLMQKVLNDCKNNLQILGQKNFSDLLQYHGIGETKALTIIAACELGRRRASIKNIEPTPLNSSEKIYRYMKRFLEDLPHEEIWLLSLNTSLCPIQEICISKGGINTSTFDVRTTVKQALMYNAVAVVLLHNHPSGACNPSKSDDEVTNKLKKATELLNIRLIDHLIIGQNCYYSYADKDRL